MTSYRNNSVLLVFSGIINIIQISNINYELTTINLIYMSMCLSIAIYNYIIFNDIYFEIKNNLDLYFYPNMYPSNTLFYNNILLINTFVFLSASSLYLYDYWIVENGINYIMDMNLPFESLKHFYIILLTLFIFTIFIISLHYICTNICNHLSLYFNQIMFNYCHSIPLFKNTLNNESNYICWICEKKMLKNDTITLLHCPCNENFHSRCIERYLGLYKNVCHNGHKITKIKNSV
jgi:hypothetical protein